MTGHLFPEQGGAGGWAGGTAPVPLSVEECVLPGTALGQALF